MRSIGFYSRFILPVIQCLSTLFHFCPGPHNCRPDCIYWPSLFIKQMKKVLKVLGIVLGSLVLLAGSFCTYVAIVGVPTYDKPTVPVVSVEVTPERVSRGEIISQIQCMGCHSDNNNQLTGKYMGEVPALFGKIYSKNITQDKENGIGQWTDGQLIYFLRTGLRADGSYAPVMPQYPNLSDEDLNAVVAWLRSDRFPVQATSKEPRSSELSIFTKLLTHLVMKPLPYPQHFVAPPDSTDALALGKYTADALGDCFGCHSADFVDQDKIHTERTKGYYGGGNEMVGIDGQKVLTANLTFDEQTGIGRKYTREQFIKAVKLGVRPDGSILKYPMTPKMGLSDREVGAIYDYLKTIPKIKNDIESKNAELEMIKK